MLLIVVLASINLSGDGSNTIFVDQDISYFLWLASAFYLAWHYTGQAWGMVSSFSFLAGIKINDTEKVLIRSGLRILLAWHVVWGAQDLPAQAPICGGCGGRVLMYSDCGDGVRIGRRAWLGRTGSKCSGWRDGQQQCCSALALRSPGLTSPAGFVSRRGPKRL